MNTKIAENINKMADKKIKMKGSEALIRCLMAEGVDTMFGYPGGAIMPVYDAMMGEFNTVRHILTRHEQGAIHAAQAFARVSGKVGVCIATSGPGATNLITGLADAMIDSTGIVCITGQVAAHLLGTDAFQETDVIGISMPVTKWNYQITTPEEIPSVMAKAFYLAKSGRPGPVLIDITKNAQFAELEFSYEKCKGIRSYWPVPKVQETKIQEAAELINNAKKPYVVYGQGIILSGAEKELDAFLTKTGIPAAWTILGHSALDSDHPLNMGMLGMHGNYAPNLKTNECDVLIAVGMRFDDRVTGDVKTYAKQAKVIHIEIDPAEVDKNIKTDVAILGDAKQALTMLTEKVNKNAHEAWVKEFKDLYDIEYDQVIQHDIFPTKEGLTMGEVIKKVSDETKGEAMLVTDVGQHQMVANRYFKFKKTRSNVTSGGLGTMGFALPAAMGARLGDTSRPVIMVAGDGGFQMTIQELGTIRQENMNIKMIILNNNFLGMVRQWQQLFFDRRYAFTELVNPDFIKISDGYGINGRRVSSRNELDSAIKEMLETDGPFILEVTIEKEDNVFPMVPTGASVSDIMLGPKK